MKFDMFTHLSLVTFFPARSEVTTVIPFTHTMSCVSYAKRDDGDDFVQHIGAEDKTWCHHFPLEVRKLTMELSRFTEALKAQSSAFSRKGDVGELMYQRFHSNNGVRAAVLNWFHNQLTSFFADGIRYLPNQ
ncbi:hypothetical protein TNCV_503741 [Trichonephila clavipes]|nr:hypothetical protein TNCV_503741 [Trichonephila clavipes]